MEIIDVRIFNPDKSLFKSQLKPAECIIYKCKNKEHCELFKNSKCILKKIFSGNCPYGIIETIKGPTKKSKKFYTWLKEHTELYKDYLNLLSDPEKIVCKVGDYYYLPYAHISFDSSLPFLAKSTIMSSGMPFIHENDFTVQTILRAINHRPHAMMGGEITDYQKKELPIFLKHLSEKYPDFFSELIKHVDITIYLKTFSNIGRKVLLSSLKSGTVIKPSKSSNETWRWNGEYLISTNAHLSFTPVKFSEHYIKIKPNPDETICIDNEDQVTTSTIFIS